MWVYRKGLWGGSEGRFVGLWENVGICDGFVGGSEGASVGMSVGMVYTEDLWVGLFGVSMGRTLRLLGH